MPEYITNTVVEKHNTWTLIKHVAGTVNKDAAKIDEHVYGTKVTQQVQTVQVVPSKPVDNHPVRDGFFNVIMGLVFIFVVIGFIIGKIGWRDFTGF